MMCAGALALIIAVAAWDRSAEPARARARALYEAALGHLAVDEIDSMALALEAAQRADPDYLVPLLDLYAFVQRTEGISDRWIRVLDRWKEFLPERVRPCLLVVRAALIGEPQPDTSGVLQECRDLSVILTTYPVDVEADLRADARLRGRHADMRVLNTWLLSPTRDTVHGPIVLAEARRRAARGDAYMKAHYTAFAALQLHWLGRHSEAVRMERAALALTEALPGARRAVQYALMDHSLLRDHPDSLVRAHADSVRTAVEREYRASVDSMRPRIRVQVLLNGTYAHLGEGKIHVAVSDAREAVRIADSLQDATLLLRSRVLLGRALVKRGDLAEAERELLAARELTRRTVILDPAYEVEHNLLHLYEALGRDRETREAGRAFVALTRRAAPSAVRFMSARDFGWYLQRRGEPDAARPYFEAMVAIIDSLNDFSSEHHFYAGEYFELIGDLDRARQYYHLVTTPQQSSRALEALVRVSEATADTAAALQFARDHDHLMGTFPEKRPLLPGVLARAGRVDEALQRFRVERQDTRARAATSSWARLTRELAETELAIGQPAAAVLHADSAAVAARSVGDEETVLRAEVLAASARSLLGEEDATAALGRLRERVARSRLLMLEAEVTLAHAVALGRERRTAAALAAFTRAQDLADAVAQSLAHDPTRASFRAAQLRPSTEALRFLARDGASLADYAAWSARRKTEPGTRFGGLAELRARVRAAAAIVDYVVLDSAIAALVITREEARLLVLRASAAEVRRAVNELYERLPPRIGSRVDRTRGGFSRGAAAALHRALLQPVLQQTGPRASLVIIPDGWLHLLPWDALVDAATERAVLETSSVIVAPSLAHAAPTARRVALTRLLAVGAPDPGEALAVRRELDAIQRAWHAERFVRLEGSAATEGTFKRLAEAADIVHVAAHAEPNVQAPDRAAIALVSDAGDDGRLHASELPALKLRDALVVLSACESGVGRALQGEGPLSLGRSFLKAGARQVVLTLWPIGAEASIVMEEFYRRLAGGASAADALRQAKLQAWRDGLDPLDWAVFVLVGQPAATGEGARLQPDGQLRQPVP